MTPATAPADEHDKDLRMPDDRLTGKPETEGVPDEEGVDQAEVEEAVDDDGTASNRQDVPPTPENSLEARTEDGREDEITEP